jgi:LPXTG-motif cell wall-anchored protein
MSALDEKVKAFLSVSYGSGYGSGSGSGSSVWYRGGNSLGASIPFDPTEVLIDGVSVPFTVDGNTITIPSLTDGPHNVKVIWRGGSYSFNITASGTGKSIVALPQTGDSSMGPYVGLCMLVFMGMLAGGAVLNRKKAK